MKINHNLYWLGARSREFGASVKLSAPTSDLRPPTSVLRALIILIFLFGLQSIAIAEEKSWLSEEVLADWAQDVNWLPAEAPTASDDAVIDLTHASAAVSQNFNVKTVTLGGKKASLLTVNNFVEGEIKPSNTSDVAFLNRKDGHMVIKGTAGKLTLKGGYKDSEEIIPDEPTFMLYVQ